MSKQGDLGIGDTVRVYEPYAQISYTGIVMDKLASQFTYQPKLGSLRFCSYLRDKWTIVKHHIEEDDEPCQTTPDSDPQSSNDDKKEPSNDFAELPLIHRVRHVEAILEKLGPRPTTGTSCGSKTFSDQAGPQSEK